MSQPAWSILVAGPPQLFKNTLIKMQNYCVFRGKGFIIGVIVECSCCIVKFWYKIKLVKVAVDLWVHITFIYKSFTPTFPA